MTTQPTLHTRRLTLRPFRLADADRVQALAGVAEVADTTLNIPHPYPPGVAAAWIATHAGAWAEAKLASYAIVERATGDVVGAVSLAIDTGERSAEIGYWVGVPYWKRGYCTEAAGALLAFGFGPLGLRRVEGRHLVRNPASGRVMEKLGMRLDGEQGTVRKQGRIEDVAHHDIVSAEWTAAAPAPALITVESDASAADVAAVEAGLRAFNVEVIGPSGEEPVRVFLRDEGGRVVGGLLGHIKWRWLYVSKLWIDAAHRGRGDGAALLTAAETHARSRGCIGAYLDTFEYQARPFYEKLGYAVFGTLEGYPPGYRQFHLAKRFADA